MKKLSLGILILIIGVFTSCVKKSDPNPVLTIEGGQIQGVETPTEGIIAYKGIPFAAPPVGDLRWKEPQPVIPWEGIKVADAYGNAASQVTWNPESFYGREWRASGSVPFSEDCLYLNVWTPAAGKTESKLPVALWIHGGGYREGFAFEPEMDGGEDWASRGVILVQVTYRLGVMGFFSHPLLSSESPNGVSGNYGLLDQVAALKWINNNIQQFGGDPNNITIFGQSAGAGSVKSLVASPLSKNLVSKAISMSGGGLNRSEMGITLDTAQVTNKKMMDYFDKTTLNDMRTLSFDEMLQMAREYADTTKTNVSWRPVIDNYLLEGTFSEVALANKIADIPYIFGFTANDGNDATQAIKDFGALRAEQSDQPTFAYLFQRQLPGDENGAFHSSDLWYAFHAFKHSWRPFNKGDEALSNQMVDYYTNFAKYGNPNGENEGLWTPYSTENPKFILFDVNGEVADISMTDSPKYLGPSPRK
ncbi:carboxylesterase/lipase family protein [Confluentibacter lentus]|uniref:carboxylesterase/lipase family protein n=1 Tax=Confluentibacter lentus TaxID=1699412 RepID=UPI000C28B7BB|nr:carboxylesterase family protein [Confluentibacter lentus]